MRLCIGRLGIVGGGHSRILWADKGEGIRACKTSWGYQSWLNVQCASGTVKVWFPSDLNARYSCLNQLFEYNSLSYRLPK